MWDERYKTHDTVYGVQPNVFWASRMALLPAGSVCLPCDGEGRNGLWAAEQGWDVHAFDLSEVGVSKTQQLAQARGVELSVQVGNAMTMEFDRTFDLVGLVFAHMPSEMRAAFHRRAWSWVKPGGHLVAEGFHRDQLGLGSGGPKTLDMLFHEDTFVEDLTEVEDNAMLVWNARCEQVLDEGPFHQGPSVTCQVVLQKQA